MKNSNDILKVVGSLVIGAAAGAALGILFAPEKGSKTRNKIAGGTKKMTEDLTKKIKDEFNSLRSKVEKVENNIEDKFNHLKDGVHSKVEDVKNKI